MIGNLMQILTEINFINQNQNIPSYIASIHIANEIIQNELKEISEHDKESEKIKKIEKIDTNNKINNYKELNREHFDIKA